MKRLFLFMSLVALSLSAVAQSEMKAGVYDSKGNALLLDGEPTIISVELRYVVEQFVPGEYARYAQKYLGDRAPLAERQEVELLSAAMHLGKLEEPKPCNEAVAVEATLRSNRLSRDVLTTEERAKETADMIFSLRKYRMDLITGQAGENVFGAGLEAALNEISRLEREYIAMFYGATTRIERTKVINVAIANTQSDYVVCRFSDTEGVVAADNLAGKVLLLHLDAPKAIRHAAIAHAEPKGKVKPESYTVVPAVKCSLLLDAALLDEASFALYPFAQTVVGTLIQ